MGIPIALAVGDGDLFMKPADVEKLQTACERSSDVSKLWLLENAGHMDLVWGKDAPKFVFRPMLAWLGATTEAQMMVVNTALVHAGFSPVICVMSVLHSLI